MEPESSLTYSQVSATSPYPEPAPSSPHNPLPLPEDTKMSLFRLLRDTPPRNRLRYAKVNFIKLRFIFLSNGKFKKYNILKTYVSCFFNLENCFFYSSLYLLYFQNYMETHIFMIFKILLSKKMLWNICSPKSLYCTIRRHWKLSTKYIQNCLPASGADA
jgi:hypothetical protein